MRSIVFLFLTFIASQLLAQDLIVKTNGDSLNCLITRNENSYMHFNQIINHRLKRDSLAMATIKTFKVDYYTTKKAVQKEEVKTVSVPKVIHPVQSRTVNSPAYNYNSILTQNNTFFLSVNAGLGLRLKDPSEKYGPQLKEYYQNLYSGLTLGAEAAYFINDYIGFGFQFSSFQSKHAVEAAIDTTGSGSYVFGTFSNDVSIVSVEPTFYLRTYSQNQKSIFIGHASIGTTMYSNEIDEIIYQYKESGNDVSLSIGGTYHYMIDKNFAIGASATYHIALINKLTYDDGLIKFTSSYYPEDVSRIDLKALLAYWF